MFWSSSVGILVVYTWLVLCIPLGCSRIQLNVQGPDRFKHINQAARNALDLGGFLDSPDDGKKGKKGKRRA